MLKEDGRHLLVDVMLGTDPGSAIEAQEKRGQGVFVASDILPIEGTKPARQFKWNDRDRGGWFETIEEWMGHPDDPWFAKHGFELGPAVEGDGVFRYGKLPTGWTKIPAADHDMWSDIADADGVVRCRVFYKAAFYDRRATIYIESTR